MRSINICWNKCAFKKVGRIIADIPCLDMIGVTFQGVPVCKNGRGSFGGDRLRFGRGCLCCFRRRGESLRNVRGALNAFPVFDLINVAAIGELAVVAVFSTFVSPWGRCLLYRKSSVVVCQPCWS